MLPIDPLSFSVRGKMPSDPTLELSNNATPSITAESFQDVFAGDQENGSNQELENTALPGESDPQLLLEPQMSSETANNPPEIERGNAVGMILASSSKETTEFNQLEIEGSRNYPRVIEAGPADVSATMATGDARPRIPRLEGRIPEQLGPNEVGRSFSQQSAAILGTAPPAAAGREKYPVFGLADVRASPVTGAITAAEVVTRSPGKLVDEADLPVLQKQAAVSLSAENPVSELSKARSVAGVDEAVIGRTGNVADDATKQPSLAAPSAGPVSAPFAAGEQALTSDLLASNDASRRQGQPIVDVGPKEFGAVLSGDQGTRAVVATPATQPAIPLGAQSNSVAQQVAMQISLQAGTARSKEIELRLEPEELGKLRITILTREAGLTVSIVAERPETLELLKRNSDQLMADLGERDLGGANLEFFEEEREETGEQASPHLDFAEPEQTNVSISVTEGITGRLDIRL